MINFNSTYSNPLANIKITVRNGLNSTNSSSASKTNSTNSSTNSANSNEVLGYKVDKDGYFTSEFNKAAGIPSDYKIHSNTMQSLVNANTSGFTRAFNSVDIAKSVGNAYKILSQVVGDSVLNSNDSFTKDEISQFSQGYEFNYQSLEINKIYNTKSELNTAIEGFNYESAFKNRQGISTLFKSSTNIFNNLAGGEESGVHWATTASKYTNADGSISKGGLLIGVLNGNLYLVEGETTNFGKLTGFDKSLNYQEMMQYEKKFAEEFAALEIDEASFGLSGFFGNDEEYKDPTQMILEEITRLQKELAKKALERQRESAKKVDIKA